MKFGAENSSQNFLEQTILALKSTDCCKIAVTLIDPSGGASGIAAGEVMSHKAKFIAVILIAGGFFCALAWLVFRAIPSRHLWATPIVLGAIVILSVVPIYPLYREASKREATSALAISLLIAGLLTGLVYVTVLLVFQLDPPRLVAVSIFSRVLIIASSLLFIWNALMKRHR